VVVVVVEHQKRTLAVVEDTPSVVVVDIVEVVVEVAVVELPQFPPLTFPPQKKKDKKDNLQVLPQSQEQVAHTHHHFHRPQPPSYSLPQHFQPPQLQLPSVTIHLPSQPLGRQEEQQEEEKHQSQSRRKKREERELGRRWIQGGCRGGRGEVLGHSFLPRRKEKSHHRVHQKGM